MVPPSAVMNFHGCAAAIISRESKAHAGPNAFIPGSATAARLCTLPLHRLSVLHSFNDHQAIVGHAPQFQLPPDKTFRQGIRGPPASEVMLLRQRQIDERRLNVKTESVCDVLVGVRRHTGCKAVRMPIPGAVSPASQKGQGVLPSGRMTRIVGREDVLAYPEADLPPGKWIHRR
jgi:hypothetical protein